MDSKQLPQCCSLCLEDEETVASVTWCTECETFLCDDCVKHHKRNRASKQHSTISVTEYQNLPEFIRRTSNRCPDHDQKYELYCSFHEAACCIKCMKDSHGVCKDIKPLSEVIVDIKSSASISLLQNDLQDMEDNFGVITKHFSSRLAEIDKQKQIGREKVQEIRRSVNEHLDRIEKKLMDELNSEHLRIKLNIESLISQTESKWKRINHLHVSLDQVTKYATNLQTLLGLKTLEKWKDEILEYFNGLNTAEDVNLDVRISDAVLSLMNIDKFGEATSLVIDNPLQLKKIKECQSQSVVPSIVKSVHHIKPVLKNKINIGKNVMITGCQILSNGNVLFVDAKWKGLLLFGKSGIFIEMLFLFKDEPKDVCMIKEEMVAVTLPTRGCIDILNIGVNNVVKVIEVGKNCNSVASNGEEIIIGLQTRQENFFLILDMDGNVLRRFPIQGNHLVRISLCESGLCYTDTGLNKILCYSMTGDLKWTFEDSQIKNPIGNMSDGNGFVYVASRNESKIVVFAPGTKERNVILSAEDGLVDPAAIHIDKKNSTLLVADLFNGSAFLFQI